MERLTKEREAEIRDRAAKIRREGAQLYEAYEIDRVEADRELLAELDAVRAERDAMHLALQNVRALAMRLRRTDAENAGHLLRFCADVGVVGSILRGQ